MAASLKQTVALLATIKPWELYTRHVFLMEEGVQPLPANWNKFLAALNAGALKIEGHKKFRAPLLRILAFRWLGNGYNQCTSPVYHSLN
jgi:hypothetical protein